MLDPETGELIAQLENRLSFLEATHEPSNADLWRNPDPYATLKEREKDILPPIPPNNEINRLSNRVKQLEMRELDLRQIIQQHVAYTDKKKKSKYD